VEPERTGLVEGRLIATRRSGWHFSDLSLLATGFMRRGEMAGALATQVTLCLVLMTPLFSAFAQSRRGSQKSQPSPTEKPAPETPSPGKLDRRSDLPADRHAEKYRLVFATSFDGVFRKGKLYYVGAEYDRALPSMHNSFIAQLNKAGAQGYKLVSAMRGPGIAIVKLDEVPYEYDWFETTSSFYFAREDFRQQYARLSQRGFRIVDNFPVSTSCEDLDPDNSASGQACVFKDLFLVERQKGVNEPVQHVNANAFPSWRTKMGGELTTQINEQLTEGYYPTSILSKYEILLERAKDKDEVLSDKPDVRVVTSSNWGRGSLEQKVNELAKSGYRLASINNGIAVMYRRSDSATPVTYVWLEAQDKSFEKQLMKLQGRGAVYRMTYPDGKGFETRLIFEEKAVDDGQRREYKVLKFEFQDLENAAEKKVNVDLTPSSQEVMREFNRLVKEGFVVRDLFLSELPSVLLERSQ
jgi:hypothetical protein